MKFDLKNPVQRKVFIYSMSLIIAILAYLLLTRINDIIHFIGSIFSMTAPFLLGFGIAFVLDGPVLWMQNRLTNLNVPQKRARAISTIVVTLLFVLFIVFALWVMIPSLIDSVRVFIRNFSTYAASLETTLDDLAEKTGLDLSQVVDFLKGLNIPGTITSNFTASLNKMMSYSANVIHWAANLLIALAAAIYMMLDKNRLLYSLKVLLYTLTGRKVGNFIMLYTMDARNIFQQYIVGNILDSLIIGVTCWFGCMLLHLPYAPMIGLIVGITNIIPVFGPFLGAIPVIFLLCLIRPMNALVFAVFILILQQVDGNVIKPIILGDKLGISGFWILFSVSIGGALFGPVGMFLGVPIFALIFEGIKDLSSLQLTQRRLVIPVSAGLIEDDPVQ